MLLRTLVLAAAAGAPLMAAGAPLVSNDKHAKRELNHVVYPATHVPSSVCTEGIGSHGGDWQPASNGPCTSEQWCNHVCYALAGGGACVLQCEDYEVAPGPAPPGAVFVAPTDDWQAAIVANAHVVLAPGTYYPTQTLEIGFSVTLVAQTQPGASPTVIISGSSIPLGDPIVKIDGEGLPFETNITFSGLEFKDGAGTNGGAVHQAGARAYFTDCKFTNNQADHGAAIYTTPAAMPASCTPWVTGCGGKGGSPSSESFWTMITRCAFNTNTAVHDGGAINVDDGTVQIALSTFEGNTAGGSGGAIKVRKGGIDILASIIHGNTAAALGGGIAVAGDQAVSVDLIQDCVVSGNTAVQGGGIGVTAASATVKVYGATNYWGPNKIEGNEASGNGAGVYMSGGFMELYQVEVKDNTASGEGGGVFMCCDASIGLELNAYFSGNSATAGESLKIDQGTATFDSAVSAGFCQPASPLATGVVDGDFPPTTGSANCVPSAAPTTSAPTTASPTPSPTVVPPELGCSSLDGRTDGRLNNPPRWCGDFTAISLDCSTLYTRDPDGGERKFRLCHDPGPDATVGAKCEEGPAFACDDGPSAPTAPAPTTGPPCWCDGSCDLPCSTMASHGLGCDSVFSDHCAGVPNAIADMDARLAGACSQECQPTDVVITFSAYGTPTGFDSAGLKSSVALEAGVDEEQVTVVVTAAAAHHHLRALGPDTVNVVVTIATTAAQAQTMQPALAASLSTPSGANAVFGFTPASQPEVTTELPCDEACGHHHDDDGSGSSGLTTGAIAGAAIGGVVGVLALVSIALYCVLKKQRDAHGGTKKAPTATKAAEMRQEVVRW